jgi:hypothetical protein
MRDNLLSSTLNGLCVYVIEFDGLNCAVMYVLLYKRSATRGIVEVCHDTEHRFLPAFIARDPFD